MPHMHDLQTKSHIKATFKANPNQTPKARDSCEPQGIQVFAQHKKVHNEPNPKNSLSRPRHLCFFPPYKGGRGLASTSCLCAYVPPCLDYFKNPSATPTSSFTCETLVAKRFFSSSLSLTSITFSTPPAPSTHGTPTK